MNRKQRRTIGKKNILSSTAELFNEAVTFHTKGNLDEAERLYREIIALDNTNSGSYNNLGLIKYFQNNFIESIDLFKKSIKSNTTNADAYNNLANSLKKLNKFDEAMTAYKNALKINPKYINIYINIGSLLRDIGKTDEAISWYEKALLLGDTSGESYLNLGNTYELLHNNKKAIEYFQKALAVMPNSASVYNNLGSALLAQGKIGQAMECLGKALALQPAYPNAYLNMGNALTLRCRPREAVECYEKVLSMEPGRAGVLSNLLLTLNYMDMEPAALARRHFEIGAQIEAPFLNQQCRHDTGRDAGRRLRIGYVSPDMRNHAVMFFLEPLMKAHDRNAVELFCYADVYQPDDATARLQALSDGWRSAAGVPDERLTELIRADGIDILVDLAGHSANNRLPVFARKPAPIQVTWLGFPNTTGMTTMDYRLVDDITDPPGVADPLASETLVRLENGFLCYQPPAEAPAPAPAPCLDNGFITFGSFNNLAKLSPETFEAWGRLLKRLPTARLLIKSYLLADEGACALCLERLAEHGIEAGRVTLLQGIADKAGHLAGYHRVDIGLDAFPYNGTTTTCDALWMGVPVVTLTGNSHAGRVGASLLTRVGLSNLVAPDIAGYVDIAAGLAADPSALATLRANLRPRMGASPLCDGPAFAATVEAAYRRMWQRRIEQAAAA